MMHGLTNLKFQQVLE